MEKPKILKGKGRVDYDYPQDILFFKTAERDYFKSVELEHIVLDIDKEGFIVGIQIFEASKFFNLSKEALRNVRHWEFKAMVNEGLIEIRLVFQMLVRNRMVEKNPIIMQPNSEKLPNSELICQVM